VLCWKQLMTGFQQVRLAVLRSKCFAAKDAAAVTPLRAFVKALDTSLFRASIPFT
jgi:hypothetical protein